MIAIGDGVEESLRVLLAPRLISAVWFPSLHTLPVYVEGVVRLAGCLELTLKLRHLSELFKIMRPGILGVARIRVEIKPIRLAADAGFQSALHHIAAHVIRSGIKPGIQQCLSVAEVLLGQMLEIAAIHRGYVLLLFGRFGGVF